MFSLVPGQINDMINLMDSDEEMSTVLEGRTNSKKIDQDVVVPERPLDEEMSDDDFTPGTRIGEFLFLTKFSSTMEHS